MYNITYILYYIYITIYVKRICLIDRMSFIVYLALIYHNATTTYQFGSVKNDPFVMQGHILQIYDYVIYGTVSP